MLETTTQLRTKKQRNVDPTWLFRTHQNMGGLKLKDLASDLVDLQWMMVDVTVFIEFHLIQNLNWCRKLWIFLLEDPNQDGKGLHCPDNCTASKAQKRCCKNLVCTECKGQKCDQPFATSWSGKGDPSTTNFTIIACLKNAYCPSISKYSVGVKRLRNQKWSYFGWVMQEIHSELSRNEPCPVWLAQQKMVLVAQETFKIIQVLIMSHAPSLLMSYTVMRLEVLRPLQPVINQQIMRSWSNGWTCHEAKTPNNLCTTRYKG